MVNPNQEQCLNGHEQEQREEGANSPEDGKEEAPWVVRPELQQGKVDPSYLKHPILALHIYHGGSNQIHVPWRINQILERERGRDMGGDELTPWPPGGGAAS